MGKVVRKAALLGSGGSLTFWGCLRVRHGGDCSLGGEKDITSLKGELLALTCNAFVVGK